MSRPGPSGTREGEKGAALLLVVLLVALLSVLVVEFQREAWVHSRTSESLRDDLQAHAVLRSGAELALQVLVIYTNPQNTFAGMQLALTQKKEAQVLWDLFFGDDWVTFPVPAGADEPYVPLSAKLVDLDGKFPVGSLADPATATVRLAAFKEFLRNLKTERAELGNIALDGLDPDDFAEAAADLVKAAPANADPPLRDLSELQQIDGVTPGMIAALTPYLDTRKQWRFSANGMSVPMLMTMLTKDLEEARQLRADIQASPLDTAAQIAAKLTPRDAVLYPPNSLVPKSQSFELFLKADVRGVLRTTRAVYRRESEQGRFKAKSWVEGWVIGFPSGGDAESQPSPTPSPSPGAGGGETQ